MQKYALTFRICNNDPKPSKYAFLKNLGPSNNLTGYARAQYRCQLRCIFTKLQLLAAPPIKFEEPSLTS
jgi:hypothetical protein